MTILPVGYTTADVVYQWTAGRGVNIASDMKLSQVSFSISGGQHCFCFKLSFLSLFVTSSLPKKIIISNYGCNVHSQFFIKTMQHKKFKLAEHSLQSLRQCVFSVRARLQCVFLVWPDQLANTITKLQIQQRRYKYEYEYKYKFEYTYKKILSLPGLNPKKDCFFKTSVSLFPHIQHISEYIVRCKM